MLRRPRRWWLATQRTFTVEAWEGSLAPPFSEYLERMDRNQDGRIEILSDLRPPFSRTLAALERRYGNGNGLLEESESEKVWQGTYGERMMIAVKLDGRGDVTGSHVKWRWKQRGAEVPSPLVYRDLIYVIHHGGILRILDRSNGELLLEKRLRDAMDRFYASPVAAAGKVYFVSQLGKVAVIEAGRDGKVLATSDLAEECYATPAIVDDRIYVRTSNSLYAFQSPPKVAQER